MFQKSAQYYDLTHGSRYASEAEVVRTLLRAIAPQARTILDVGCGTGGHHAHLATDYAVSGVDIVAEFIDAARQKNPAGTYALADMTAFDLGARFDVVTCLYSSIGYLRSLEELRRTLRCFRDHLAPGGVVLVEPWATPESWVPGQIRVRTIEADGVSICRMSETETKDGLSCLNFHYLVGRDGRVEYFTERHVNALFAVPDIIAAFRSVGLEAEYLADFAGLSDRGLYVAREAGG